MANSLVASLGLDSTQFTSGLSDAKNALKSFSDGIKKQIKGIKDFGIGLKNSALEAVAMAKGMSAGQLATAGLTLATKALKVALVSTGIGAIVVALGSLVAYLTTTQAGMDALRRVTEPVAQIFGRLLGVLQELGGSTFKGISLMLNGELAEGFRVMSEGAKNAGKGIKTAFTDGLEAGGKLAEMTEKIEQAENDLILTRSRLNRQIAEAKEQATFLSTTDSKQARKFADEAIKLIDERTKAENHLLQMKIDKMKLEHQANDTSRADYKELNMLIAEQEELIARGAKQRQSLNAIIVMANKDALKNQTEFNREILTGIDYMVDFKKEANLPMMGMVKGKIQMRDTKAEIQRGKEAMAEFNEEVKLTDQITNLLAGTFDSVFTAMVTNGENAFKVLVNGIKALITRLLVAVATAVVLTTLLSAIGIGGFSFANFGTQMKETFGSLSGLTSLFSKDGGTRLAEGGMVTGITRAIIGDNPSGKEAVIPFEKMGTFLSRFGTGSRSGGVYEFILRNDVLYSAVKSAEAKELRIITG